LPSRWTVPGCRRLTCFASAAMAGARVWSPPNTNRRPFPWNPSPRRVYWIEELEATPEQLGRLADHGLWPASGHDAQRRAEGFNRFEWGAG